MEFLTGEDLLALIPFLEVGHVMQGYGLLDEIPTLYGLIWITPKFMDTLVEKIKRHLFNHQRSGKYNYSCFSKNFRNKQDICFNVPLMENVPK